MSNVDIELNLKKLKFPNRLVLIDILNKSEIDNIHKNKTFVDDFVGQLELSTDNLISLPR